MSGHLLHLPLQHVQSGVLTPRHNLQVFRCIIPLVSIDVVNNFIFGQRTPQHLFGNDTVGMSPVSLGVRFPFAGAEPVFSQLFPCLWCHSCRVEKPIHFRKAFRIFTVVSIFLIVVGICLFTAKGL